MITELTGEIIQMNAHMVVTDLAVWLISIGAIVSAVFVIFSLISAFEKSWKDALLGFAVVIVGVAMLMVGVRMPRVKEIHACVNGPFSLERVSAVYNIMSVDGTELVLRER